MTALVNPYWYGVAATDPSFANVVLLLHCEGTNGSTTITDSSLSAHPCTAVGSSLTTAQQKFGTASLANASNTTYVTTADSADWYFAAGRFTIEAFVRITTTISGIRGIVAQWFGASNLGWRLAFNAANLEFAYSTTGTDFPTVSAAYSPTLNTWVHIAVDRDASNVVRVYADGVIIASATVSATFFNSTNALDIANDGNRNRGLFGQIDELRITKGIARYAGAFTPPTASFPNA